MAQNSSQADAQAATDTRSTCTVRHTYGSYGLYDMTWLYAYYDLETQKFIEPRIVEDKGGRSGELYFKLDDGKQYILFYYHKMAYITIEREIEASLVEVCCDCDDKIKLLGKTRIEFSSFEWLADQRRRWIIPQQIMTFLQFVPYFAKPPEFTAFQQSKDEQERLLQMIRLGVVLRESKSRESN